MRDYIDLFDDHDAEQEKRLDGYVQSRPVCACCGEVIMGDFAICIDDDWFCDEKECRAVAMEALWDKHKNEYRTSVA